MSLKRNHVVDYHVTARCQLLNILMPTPVLSVAHRLDWFWWRRRKRLQAIASRQAIPIDFVDQVMAAYEMRL
jgi:hypothetical protein